MSHSVDLLTKPKYIRAPSARKAPRAMIQSIEIKGYRGFSHFEIGGLGRVNLLVGKNNSGKTSVLEVLNLLESRGDPNVLWRIVSRRGERIFIDPPARQPEFEFEVSHLFHGHELKIGAQFLISAKNQSHPRSVKCTIAEATKEAQERLTESEGHTFSPVVLELSGTPKPPLPVISLTRRGGLRGEAVDMVRRGQRSIAAEINQPQFISTESLSFDALSFMWNQIALTDAQKRVVKALRFIEPKIEDFAPQITTPYYYAATRGGFIVKMENLDQPIPIGSLGDGIWRILALAIALSRAKDSILLVDEIDTGLHHTVMSDMWTLIAETAKILNVQVFATTHSYDCVHSLSKICDADVTRNSQVTLQRIDPSKKRAIPFTEAEIRMAAERKIEVR